MAGELAESIGKINDKDRATIDVVLSKEQLEYLEKAKIDLALQNLGKAIAIHLETNAALPKVMAEIIKAKELGELAKKIEALKGRVQNPSPFLKRLEILEGSLKNVTDPSLIGPNLVQIEAEINQQAMVTVAPAVAPAPIAAPASVPVPVATTAPTVAPVAAPAPITAAPAPAPAPAPSAAPAPAAAPTPAPAPTGTAPEATAPATPTAPEADSKPEEDGPLDSFADDPKVKESIDKLKNIPMIGPFLLSFCFSAAVLSKMGIKVPDLNLKSILAGVKNMNPEKMKSIEKRVKEEIFPKQFGIDLSKSDAPAKMALLSDDSKDAGSLLKLTAPPEGFDKASWDKIVNLLKKNGANNDTKGSVFKYVVGILADETKQWKAPEAT